MNSLNLVMVSRKKILKTLDRVFPHPRFLFTEIVNAEGKVVQKVELTYRPPGTKEQAPICDCEIPSNGSELGAMNALLIAAFKSLGADAVWNPKFPGRYELKLIANFTGPEQAIPAELDPSVTTEEQARAMLAQNDPAAEVKPEVEAPEQAPKEN